MYLQKKNSIFFQVFFLVFLFRSILIFYSLSDFPWFYEWEGMKFLKDIKNSNYKSFLNYELKTQFLIYTKTLYILLFKIFNDTWHPKLFTILIQIIPSLYISIIVLSLFKNIVFKSRLILITLFFNVITIGSLANFFHFSESHFYFQILIFIILLWMYCEKKIDYKFYILLFSSSFNMELAGLLIPLSLIFLNLYDKYFQKVVIDLRLIIVCTAYIIIALFVIKILNLPVLNDGSQVIEKTFLRSSYILVKALFHQSALFLGFVLIFYLIFNIYSEKKFFDRIKSNKFLVGLIIFFILNAISIAANRIQIYDRYRDILQIGCFISIYLINEIFEKKNKFIYCFSFMLFLTSLFNFGRILDKSIDQRYKSIKYDKIISNYISDKNPKKSLRNIKIGELYRHEDKIKISVKYKIIKITPNF